MLIPTTEAHDNGEALFEERLARLVFELGKDIQTEPPVSVGTDLAQLGHRLKGRCASQTLHFMDDGPVFVIVFVIDCQSTVDEGLHLCGIWR